MSRSSCRHEEQRVLLEALRRIPLDMQITIELFYWERMALLDIADVLEIPEGTVKSRLHRAKQRLREEVERGDGGDEVLRSTIDDLDAWARSVREVVATRIPP